MNFRRALAWAASGQLSRSLIRFFSSIAIARLLLPEEVGIFALAMSAGVMLGILREIGGGAFLVQKEGLQTHHIQSAYGVMIIIAIIAAGLCLLSRSWIAVVYKEPALEVILGFVALHFLVWPLAEPAQALLSRELRFDVVQKAAVLAAAAGALTSVSLAYGGFGPIALAYGLLARSFTQTAVVLAWKRDHLLLRPSLRDAREIISFGGFIATASICGHGGTEGRKLVLGDGLGLNAVGWLDRAISLPVTFQAIIFAPLNDVLLPKFSQMVHERRDISIPYLKIVSCGAVIAWPVYFTLAIVATPVVVILFGENWRGAGYLLTFILAARALVVVVPNVDQVLIAHAKTRRLFALRFVMMAVSLTAYVYAMRFGLLGFGVAIVALAVMGQSLSLLCLRFIGIDAMGLARAMVPVIPVTILTAVPMILVLFFVDREPGFLWVAAGTIGSGVSWLAAVYVMRRSLPEEIEALRRSLLAQLRRILPA
jgi:O-antigen/teichoic acid export membrane protein